jgi:PST family polysaccharide transporter
VEADDPIPATGHATEPPELAPRASSLKVEVARSFGWSLVGQMAQRGATWLSTLLLVHVLKPEDYGTYSIAATVAMFLLSFNDVAVSYAVTRHRGDDLDEVAGTAASIALITSFTIFVAVFLTAPFIVALFNPPAGSPAVGVVRLTAVAIVVDGSIAAHGGLITRALREQIRVVCELAGFVFAITVNFALAFAGFGAWSLAAGQVIGSVVTAGMIMVRCPMRVRLRWHTDQARALTRFGVPLMLAGTFNQLILNTDYVLVNRYLSLATAGAYFVAFNVSNWPVTLINFAMRRSAIGGFSRLQHDQRALQRAFGQAVVLLVSATLPMALLITLLADDIMTFLFPARYSAGAIALRFLAGVSVFRLVFTLCVDLLTVLGRSVVILWVQVVWWLTLLAGMWWGAIHYGLVGVGVAQLITALVVALPLVNWCLSREGVRLLAALPGLVRPLLAGSALVAACLAARLPFHESGLRMVAGGAAGCAAYGLVALPGTPVIPHLRELVARRRAPVPG